jgi:hypothetical protein
MTNTEIVYQAGALGAALAVVVALTVWRGIIFFRQCQFEYDYMKHPRLLTYSEFSLCSGPHEWTDVKLALRGLPFGDYRVCAICGAISGNTEFMASHVVLKHIREANEIKAKEKALKDAINQRIGEIADGTIDRYIRAAFPVVSDPSKLKAYAKFVLNATADATEKVAAELKGQKDLDAKYAEWPSKIKGNA